MLNPDPKYELFLARDIADMVIEYSRDANALEFISSICFNLDMIFESSQNHIPWSELFSITDQASFSDAGGISHDKLKKLKEISGRCQQKIEGGTKDRS